jgi:hypothetical protein
MGLWFFEIAIIHAMARKFDLSTGTMGNQRQQERHRTAPSAKLVNLLWAHLAEE